MSTKGGRSFAALLLRLGTTQLAVVTVLVVLLAVLPGRRPFLATTISSEAYGPHQVLVFALLLIFGLATATLAGALSLRLRGPAGLICGGLVGVWAVAAVFDAFVRTESRSHAGTAFGQIHTMAAVTGIAAQILVAGIYFGVVRKRLGRVSLPIVLVTSIVVAGVLFVVVHPDSLAGLSERLLLAASSLWMIVCVRAAPPRRRRDCGVQPRVSGLRSGSD